MSSVTDFTSSLVGTLFAGQAQAAGTPVRPPQPHPQPHPQNAPRERHMAQPEAAPAGTPGAHAKAPAGRTTQGTMRMEANAAAFKDPLKLNEADRRQLDELRRRDQTVRAHEQTHLNAAGAHATGGARYTYRQGPDGRPYAVGGSVSLDVSKVPGDAEKTAEKARAIRRAALAPAQPSAKDQQVAAEAAVQEAEARHDMRRARDDNEHSPGALGATARRARSAYARAAAPPDEAAAARSWWSATA